MGASNGAWGRQIAIRIPAVLRVPCLRSRRHVVTGTELVSQESMQTEMSNDGPLWVERLRELGFAVRRHLRGVAGTEDLSRPVAQESGDTVYGLDRHVEAVIVNAIESWDDRTRPLLLVAEGMGEDGRLLFGRRGIAPRYRLIVDPIDGTRALMYDKRSAWFLAAVARDRGEQTRLAHAFGAVMVELPTSKQG